MKRVKEMFQQANENVAQLALMSLPPQVVLGLSFSFVIKS
jgi:hypothetical protein